MRTGVRHMELMGVIASPSTNTFRGVVKYVRESKICTKLKARLQREKTTFRSANLMK